MALPADLLDLPAPRAARLVALERLDKLLEARVRLSHPEDPERLHDFRVALRRLRSVIRAYREALSSSVGRGTVGRLRRLARATGESRDLEVHLTWLEEQRATLTPRQRVGLDVLRAQLLARRAGSDERLDRVIATTFPHLAHRVHQRLSRYDAPVHQGLAHADPAFATVLAGRVREKVADLRAAFEDVHAATDALPAHHARIVGKRLRYLLEPLAALVPETVPLLQRLSELQDQLGSLHDAHVFAPELVAAASAVAAEHARRETLAVVEGGTRGRAARREHKKDPRPGLIALGERVRARGDAAFTHVRDNWLGAGAEPVLAEALRIAAQLEARGRPLVEIERKFLLARFPPAAADAPSMEIEQGYVPGQRLIERLRRVTATDGVRWYRTVKAGAGVVRTEIEEETSREIFEAIWPLTEGKRVHKQRHRVADGDLTWEIDHFLDRDLTLAEIELPAAEMTPVPPEWLQPYLVREVTIEPDYLNYNLAR